MTTVREAIEEYHHAKHHLSPYTRRGTRLRLAVFVAWCEAHGIELEILRATHIRAFLQDVEKRQGLGRTTLMASTVRSYAATIKAFMAWAAREEEFEDVVSSKVAARVELPKVGETIIDTFTNVQLEALLLACDAQPFAVRDKAMVSVLIDTGCRASELVGLTLDCVWLDPDDRYIKVTGKGRKERELALGRAARLALRRYITRYRKPKNRAERHVFLSRTNRPLTVSGLEQVIEQIGETASISGVRCSPHTLRHTFATNFLLQGGEIYHLSRLMGHSDIKQTSRYLRAIKARQARQGGQSVLDHLKDS
jgi:site-specific recombinase XerD